jgi:all-trans-retinol dehydrogenase (NAD+)
MIALTRLSDYCASKFALLGWLEGLRLELHKNKSSITVSTVCPFLVDTKMFTGISVKFPANLLLRTLNKQGLLPNS